MIKSFSGQVICFAIPEPYLLTLAKTEYPSIYLFSLQICNYGCYLSGNLKLHMLSHTKERQFVCDLCDVQCLLKTQLDTVHIFVFISDL